MDPFEDEADRIEEAYANRQINDCERDEDLRDLGRAEIEADDMERRMREIPR